MQDNPYADLAFERTARCDYRVWIALICGLWIVISPIYGGLIAKALANGLWNTFFLGLYFLVGLGFIGFASLALFYNTSRGCRIDPKTEELIWWEVKFQSRKLSQVNRFPLDQIEKLVVDTTNDEVIFRVFDLAGRKRSLFAAHNLPHDYLAWVDKLQKHFPHIQVERIRLSD